MAESLATVDRLAARLGKTLTANTPDYARADEALWQASVRARKIAGQTWPTKLNVPDDVVDVVLSAACRIFRNPNRYLMNQGGSFQATLAQSDFANGDIFLPGEIAVLVDYKTSSALWTQPTTRCGTPVAYDGFVPVEGSDEPFLMYADGEWRR